MAISFSSGIERILYEDCEFENVRFFRPLSANYELRRCRFINCAFDTWFTDEADIIDCSFTGAIKRGVMAARTGPAAAQCVITGNDFSGTSLHDFGFRYGVDLSLQRLPSGPEYFLLLNGADAVRSVYDEVTGWTDLSARKEVLYHLRGLKIDVDDGQRDILLTGLGVPRQRRAFLLELERLLSARFVGVRLTIFCSTHRGRSARFQMVGTATFVNNSAMSDDRGRVVLIEVASIFEFQWNCSAADLRCNVLPGQAGSDVT